MRTKNSSVTRLDTLIVNSKVKSILNKHKKNNIFVVGVSGGPDSLALSYITNSLKNKSKFKFFFALVDHGIRKNSNTEALKVKDLLKNHKIKLEILRNKKKIKNNIQKNARDIRYQLLEGFCKKKKAKSLLMAHHQDDQVETFLIRLSRGSGVEGLSSMQEMTTLRSGIRLIRPLLEFNKKTLKNIAKQAFGKVFNDPSNVNKKYLRTNIRSLKSNLVNKGINIEKIVRSIKNLASTKEALDFYVLRSMKKFVKFEKNSTILNLVQFQKEPQEIRFRIINDIVKKRSNSYYPPRSKKVINLINGFKNNRLKKCTLGGCIFERKKSLLYVSKEF